MDRMIPRGKMSKKEKKAYDQRRRVVWQFSPVTRKKESAKAYSRKKRRRYGEDDPYLRFFFAIFSVFTFFRLIALRSALLSVRAFFRDGLRFCQPSPPRPESCSYSSTVPSVTFTYTM